MYCNQCGAELNSEGKFCSNCGAAVVGVDDQPATETTAKQSYPEPRLGKTTTKSGMSINTKAILIAVSIGMVPLMLLLFALSSGDLSNSPTRNSTISGDASKSLIKLAGEPDLIESSEYDNPRPPMVVKIFTYKKQNVQLVFIPDAPLNAPPPYRAWALAGASDAQTGESLSVDELNRRMGLRLR